MLEWLVSKRQKITSVADLMMCRKGNPLGRNVNWCNHCEKRFELLYDPTIPLLGIYSKEMKILT